MTQTLMIAWLSTQMKTLMKSLSPRCGMGPGISSCWQGC